MRVPLACLSAAALFLLGSAPPARAQEPDEPADVIVAEPLIVEGISDSVDEIMARDARLPRGALRVWDKPKPKRRPAKAENPEAPALAQWPPAAPAPEDAIPSLLRAEASRLPQTVGVDFHAIQLAEAGFIPPDSIGDVGPTQILVASNGRIKVFSKTGVLGSLNTTTDNFFAIVGGLTNGTTDPHIRFDRLTQRWFIVIIDLRACPNNILMAVSSGPTITGTSNFTYFSFTGESNHFTDYPTLGVDRNALYIGANMFPDTGPCTAAFNTTAWVVNKASMIGGTATIWVFRNLIGASTGILTPQGVDNDDPASTQGYFVGVDAFVFSRLILKRISNPGGTPTMTPDLVLNVPTTVFPQPQPQPAPGPTLDALDDRLFAAAIRRNKMASPVTSTLWTAHNIEVNASCVGNSTGSRNGSRWYEIQNLSTTPSLRQSGTLCDAAGTPFGYWIPSVAMSGQGHMALGASRAGTSAGTGFASVAAAGRLRGDALGTTQAPTLVFQSGSLYDIAGFPAPERWGDYSQTVVDPTDDQTMWTFQEYANATNSWGVRVTQLRAPPPATPSSAAPASVFTNQPSVNVTISGTSTAGSEFFDPGADTGGPGYPNRIAASISGGVTVNSVTFNPATPTQVTLNISTVGAPGGAKNVTVTNPDGQSRTGNGILTVIGCSTITVNPATVPAATVGQSYVQAFTQTGGTTPVTFGLAGTLPSGITFNPNPPTVSGTPTQTGSFPFTITVTDANNCTGSRDYTLSVGCGTITVTPTTIPSGTAGTPYLQGFTATGTSSAPSWTLTGTLPTGLSFDTVNGVISGTPTQSGSFPITVTATDNAGCSGNRSYTLVIDCPAITVSPTTIPSGTAGSPYSQTFTQAGGVGTITWSVTGSLPGGLTLNPNTGVLSGTPTDTGTFSITITATDANGCVGTRSYSLVINCQAITVSPAVIPGGTAGAPYTHTFTQAGGIGLITWTLNGALPAGLSFDSATGVLSGTPTVTGTFVLEATATDRNGCSGTRTVSLVIGCQAITVTPPVLPPATAGTAYSQAIGHSGGIGAMTWTVVGTLPAGMTFSPAGVLSGTPAQLGGFDLLVTGRDSNDCTTSRRYTLLVNRAGPFVPTALAVDQSGNRVLEAGEMAVVAPGWRNDTGAPEAALTGLAASFTGPGAQRYTIFDDGADYGEVAAGATATCSSPAGNCYTVEISTPPSRPALHWDSTLQEALSNSDAKAWTLHVGGSFSDVPATSGFYRFIETLLHRSVTGGCGPNVYCPTSSTARDQMAVFVLVAKEGPSYSPPACTTPMFADVPASSPFCRWIEELARRQVVAGCGGGNYCPTTPVTREQMAIFVLRTLDPALDPPACTTPMFTDVPAASPFCRWIEELARRQVVTGCGGGAYCPTDPVTREQMGVFITATFGLTLYGP